MKLRVRLGFVTALCAAAFAGCGGRTELTAFPPDSGAMVVRSPDADVPRIPGDAPGPDTTSSVQPGGTASFTASPPSVDFGTFDLGTSPAPVVVTVANTGTATSGPLRVVVSGAGITAAGCAGTTLAPQANCKISITAKPTTGGRFDGRIEVGDSPANSQTIPVTGLAWRPGLLSISPSPLDLGTVLVGKAVSGTIVLKNSTIGDLTGIVMNVSGVGFSLSPTGTCTDKLAMNQTCNIVVGFAAGSAAGPAKGVVTVSQGGVTKPVQVTATVVSLGSTLIMTPPTASFQTVLGTPSTPFTFHVTGDVSSMPLTVTITGSNKNDFSFTTDCNGPLAPGVTNACQVTVVYNPKVIPAANATATLTVAQPGATGASASATLAGLVVSGGPPPIVPNSGSFGAVVVGQTSAEITFTIDNRGDGETSVTQVTSDIAAFEITTDHCTGKTVPPKSHCTFTVVFKPAVGDKGVLQGQIKATLGPGPGWVTIVSVTGIALPAAKLVINPKSLEFGALPLLQESPAQTLTVSNAGGAPTGPLKVDKLGAAFAIKGDTCTGTSLNPSGATKTCTITVTYTPAAPAAEATGGITVADVSGVAAEPVTATMHGKGTLDGKGLP